MNLTLCVKWDTEESAYIACTSDKPDLTYILSLQNSLSCSLGYEGNHLYHAMIM